MIQKPFRPRSRAHLAFVATFPCLICNAWPVEVHHLLTAQPKAMSRKAGDQWCVPLCYHHHRGPGGLHPYGNERRYMENHNQHDYLDYARRLAEESPCAKVKEAA